MAATTNRFSEAGEECARLFVFMKRCYRYSTVIRQQNLKGDGATTNLAIFDVLLLLARAFNQNRDVFAAIGAAQVMLSQGLHSFCSGLNQVF
jgi:hypothetical protein